MKTEKNTPRSNAEDLGLNQSWFDNGEEMKIADTLVDALDIRCFEDRLFTLEKGLISVAELIEIIFFYIKGFLKRGHHAFLKNLVKAIRLVAPKFQMKSDLEHLHFNNGTLEIKSGRLSQEKMFSPFRLRLDYNADAPEPTRWKSFLSELLENDDIRTLQQYMGYLLLPTTKAQCMLSLIGTGGEGKSRVGEVVKKLMGPLATNGSVASLASNRFTLASHISSLVMIDDDLTVSALGDTAKIKTIITATSPIEIERKGEQAVNSQIYLRILAFGNESLTSIYDRSDGLYRRIVSVNVKPKAEGRVDDPFLDEKLESELPGILLWAIEGLKDLIANDFKLYVSDRTAGDMATQKKDSDSFQLFVESKGFISFENGCSAATKELYDSYTNYCIENALAPHKVTTFGKEFAAFAKKKGLTPNKNIKHNGSECRGYNGVRTLPKQALGWVYDSDSDSDSDDEGEDNHEAALPW